MAENGGSRLLSGIITVFLVGQPLTGYLLFGIAELLAKKELGTGKAEADTASPMEVKQEKCGSL